MSANSKSILFVVRDTRYFISHRLPLAERLKLEGYRVSLCSMLHDESDRDKLRHFELAFYEVPNGRGIWGFLLSIIFCKIAIFKVKPSIVHAISTRNNLVCAVASLGHRTRLIYLFAGLGTLFRSERWKHRLGAYLYGRFFYLLNFSRKSSLVFMNHADLDDFGRHCPIDLKRCQVISGSGVDLERFSFRFADRKTQANKLVIGFAGRLLADKGIFEFLDAANILIRRFPHLIFEIAGDVDPKNPTSLQKDDLLKHINQINVKWLGEVKNIEKIITNWDIFCFPSYHEGLSLSLLQAAAMGRQLVVSDIPGNRLVVKDIDYGYLFKVKDVQSLAAILAEAVENQKESIAKAVRAMDFVRSEYSIQTINDKYMSLYQEREKK